MDIRRTNLSDLVIQVAAEAELNWTPEIEAEVIRVDVVDTVVTLSGVVANDLKYLACSRAMNRVDGVSAVINNVTVQPSVGAEHPAGGIAESVQRALHWEPHVPRTVEANVRYRHVTLSGDVNWTFQRETALHVVERLDVVDSVDDQMSLAARTPGNDAERSIKRALLHNPQIDARDVTVFVVDGTATLTGWVRSLAEKRQAGLATGASPDVAHINNRLRVHSRQRIDLPTTPSSSAENDPLARAPL